MEPCVLLHQSDILSRTDFGVAMTAEKPFGSKRLRCASVKRQLMERMMSFSGSRPVIYYQMVRKTVFRGERGGTKTIGEKNSYALNLACMYINPRSPRVVEDRREKERRVEKVIAGADLY